MGENQQYFQECGERHAPLGYGLDSYKVIDMFYNIYTLIYNFMKQILFLISALVNIAFQKTVTASKLIYAGSRFVDGIINESYAMGSNGQIWVLIDLGKSYSVREV